MKIERAFDKHKNYPELLRWLRGLAVKSGVNPSMVKAPDNVAVRSPIVSVAYVNHGRWVADCPDCNAAMIVQPGETFFCGACFNASLGGSWRPLVWPADVRAIEVELEKRPARNMNWRPDETVADLRRDNDAMGVR